MSRPYFAVIAILIGPYSFADVFTYEAESRPEDAGWEISQIVCDPDLWLESEAFFVHVELCEGYPPPGGQSASYKRSLEEFVGEEEFFIEWRMETDGERSEIPWGAPAALAAWSLGEVNYTFFIARDQVKLNRDNQLPIIFVDIEPGVPHTHRLELYGDELYVWYIDGEVVDFGVPEGAYPSFDPRLTWVTRAVWLPNTTQWDYIRFGTIPAEGSGDYDSDEDVDLRDFYFFDECLTNGGPGVEAGPGCLWADMDEDDDVDFHDFALFQLAFTGSE